MRPEYRKKLSSFPTEAVIFLRLSQLLHDGRCHRSPTQFTAHIRHTNRQLIKSFGEFSFEKIDIRISGGKYTISGNLIAGSF
jgi:hypothetical protein